MPQFFNQNYIFECKKLNIYDFYVYKLKTNTPVHNILLEIFTCLTMMMYDI